MGFFCCMQDPSEHPSTRGSVDVHARPNGEEKLPAYAAASSHCTYDDTTSKQISFIEKIIESHSSALQKLSMDMWNNPETAYKEFKTRDLFVKFLKKQKGWQVTANCYDITPAYEAVFTHKPTSSIGQTRVVGFNSEMDALPGVGQACGHNLIAIAGVAAALATAQSLVKFDLPGQVRLLGTPAEEDIGGKIDLLKAGAYKSMDACLMVHPGPIDGMLPMLAIAEGSIEYTGAGSHAAGAPWEGVNALDACVIAYTSLSALRQQIKPSQRIHCILKGSEDFVLNIIPAKARLVFAARSETRAELEILKKRVVQCLEAAALASGCSTNNSLVWSMDYDELRNSPPLAKEYIRYMRERQDFNFPDEGPTLGSTDFGNISYALPALHPIYSIPIEPGQGNHTPGFTRAAATPEAHAKTLRAAKGIAASGWRVLTDHAFSKEVKEAFEEDERKRPNL
ncbi:uncharacterized protein L969DRAFT_54557 [Mixia osmundae IAM 14324]|uniref:Peptidase M20 domain-containing protein 2 n=1 Tax=Mixia osmundae (strain CBS 9802 / IAM 14324 / JCM 22182 / KY 12970) TaxID=764103 RepID=G7E1V4_MIXOS|nr:uncharacterized protein L969DRAFT_54557 [Mixia osmundae IAM 14324]KEI36760.1 hypothetical protein L969DRAFT_54557 [Mixia osmundae IAM 14324]GAA96814.1 hypothetical protein E5Q_03486 [Mixia osmundae IAM 14324]